MGFCKMIVKYSLFISKLFLLLLLYTLACKHTNSPPPELRSAVTDSTVTMANKDFVQLPDNLDTFENVTMPDNKKITLQQGQWTSLESAQFCHATTGEVQPAYPTFVKLRADSAFLHVEFRCENDPFVGENTMTRHNEPLYNQEVFEVFIAPGTDDPTRYLEVEINPNDALWVGKIHNATLGGPGGQLETELVDPDAAGFRHSAHKGEKSWSGTLSIPWRLIGEDAKGMYRVNFYRIVSRRSHANPNWQCDVETCDFLCWNATMSGVEPAFHRPRRFGVLGVLGE